MTTPETKFAQSGGVSTAYQVVGNGPIDIVYVPGFMSHVELSWEYSPFSAILNDLASYGRLIVLDKRGTGLSDRSMGLGTFEERMDDVRAVMDAAGVVRAALVGVSEGGAMCTLMAAMHPDRVTKLVLLAAACPGVFARREPERENFLEFVRSAWYTGKVMRYFIQNAADPEVALAKMARCERRGCRTQWDSHQVDRRWDTCALRWTQPCGALRRRARASGGRSRVAYSSWCAHWRDRTARRRRWRHRCAHRVARGWTCLGRRDSGFAHRQGLIGWFQLVV